MNADVTALLACETGRGRLILGEGPMSMGRAFHFAGSRSVLMSLWNIDETAAMTMGRTFFEKLLEGKSKAQAFKEARDDLRTRDNGKFDHPAFWAPLILVGEAE